MKLKVILIVFIALIFFGCINADENKIINNAKKYFEENYSEYEEFGEPSLTNEGFGKFRVDFSREGGWEGCKVSKVSIYLDNEANVINYSEKSLCPN